MIKGAHGRRVTKQGGQGTQVQIYRDKSKEEGILEGIRYICLFNDGIDVLDQAVFIFYFIGIVITQ